MEDLKRQLDILIDKTQEKKATQILHGLSGDIRESDGELQAFRLIKLLIDTNLKINIDN